jgi:gliding motility-associated-like protein
VIQNPVATLSGATICNGQSTTLNALPNGANYSWSPGGATTQSLLVSPTTTTNYTVTVSIGGCPSTSATASVIVNPVPLVSINTPNPICNGSSTSLTASPNIPNGTFIWSPAGQTTNTITINPTVNTPYSVIYTLNNCSSIPDTVIVVVNPVPTVSFNDTTICFGQNATLSSIGAFPSGGTYLWSTGETTSQINVVPSVTTIYTLQYTLNGCTGSFTDTVFVNIIPTVTPQANQTVCYGTQACINALVTPAGGTYQWSGLGVVPPANNSAQLCVTPLSGNPNVNDTIPYQIIYTVNGCSDTASTNIIVKLIPTVTAWANFDTICPGNSSELYSIGLPGISNGQTGTYAWTPSATLSVSVGDTVTATPLSTTTYNVIYTLNGCPSTPASVVITLATAPQVAIVNNPTGSICIGGCVVLSAVPSATLVIPSGYVWNTGATTQSITVCPLDTTNYSVIGTLGNCASPLATTVINVVADPIINTQPIIDTIICEGGTYPLSFGVSGGLGTPSYQWYTNSFSSTIGAVPIPGATSSNYLPPVFALDANYFFFCEVVYPVQGCNTLISDMAEIVVINDPIVTTAPNSAQIMCVGGIVECLVPTVTGGIGSNNYSWFQFTPTSITSVSSTEVFCPETDSAGNFVYGLVVSQTGIGCVSSTSLFDTVLVVPDPILTISTTDVVCNGGAVSVYSYLNPNSPGLGATSYQWQQASPPGSGFVNIPGETNDNYNSPELYASVDYQLIVTQAGNGCNAVSNVEPVLVVPDPVMQLSYDPFGCVGTYNQIDVNILGGTGSYVISWFSNDTSLNSGGNLVGVENDLSFTTTGFFAEETYYYYAQLSMSGLGCDGDTSTVATIQSMNWANASFDVDSYQNSILNPTFSFTNTSTNATAYAWDLGECATSSVSLFATPTPYYNVGSFNQLNYTYGCEPGYYEVTLIANNQGFCPDTAMAIIQIYDDVLLYVPNSFTPNGDGMNDVFHPVITSGIRPNTYSFTVFNRWGEVVYQTNDPIDGWDGFKNNKLCQDGTYTWLIKFFHSQNGDAKEFVGHINLLK